MSEEIEMPSVEWVSIKNYTRQVERADRAERRERESSIIRSHLARICGAFTGGIYCTNCGLTLDDCDCIIGEARTALAATAEAEPRAGQPPQTDEPNPLCVCGHSVSDHSSEIGGCEEGTDDWWCGCPLTHDQPAPTTPREDDSHA